MEAVLRQLKVDPKIPKNLILPDRPLTKKGQEYVKMVGFKSTRFNTICIYMVKQKIRIALVMDTRIIHAPKIGYLGVKEVDGYDGLVNEVIRLSIIMS